MTNPQQPSILRRWLVSLLFWYALALIIYLTLRWTIQPNWSPYLLVHNIAFYLFLPVIVGVVIAMLLRAPRIAGIYWILTVIGLVWFIPRLMPAIRQAEQNGTPLKIVTFNIYPHNTRLASVTDWLLAQDADVIALQEIGTELPALSDAYPYIETQGFEASQAVFSRYPIEESATIQLADTPHQRLRLNINEQQVVLYNVHLYMPLSEDETPPLLLRYDESRRNEQINDLLTFVAEETVPVIVAGDFNMSEFSPIYARLHNRLNDGFREASWGLGQTWPAGASEELGDDLPPLLRLDYVWYTHPMDALAAQVGPQLGSDHLPLTVTLDIRP